MDERQKAFIESEKKGREKWEQYFGDYYKNIQFTDLYDNYDVITYTPRGNNRINWEIKNRDIPHEKYEDKGFMLEKTKYDALINADGIGFYCNFFADDYIAIWNVRNIDTRGRWKKRWCTSTTAGDSYREEVKLKDCIDLFPSEAVKYVKLPATQNNKSEIY